ncbi:MAG: hypothetical protein FD122_1810 [Stygiobacter sp.]|nr:MAG: hypothetical protein FD122_1810 [Stygiobacter sp.]KAF0212239.1 MAG: hypothetical protein FD178_3213 [Ignavibacteria bacterium]
MSELYFSLTDKPSFLDGFARVLDLSGSLNIYNDSQCEGEADIKALRSDWEAIGKDLGAAIESEKQRREFPPKE